jgi:hypothetical protein
MHGYEARCAACGAPRNPLDASAVNVAGRPTQVGGTVANAFGWTVLVGGVLVALVAGAILQALFPAGFAGWAVGLALTAVCVIVGLPIMAAGRRLRERGKDIAQQAEERAVFALAAHRGGALTANDVAHALGISATRADERLTHLARQPDGRVQLEIDPHGHLVFEFPELAPMRVAPADGARIAPAPIEASDGDAALDEPSRRAPGPRRAPSARPPR